MYSLATTSSSISSHRYLRRWHNRFAIVSVSAALLLSSCAQRFVLSGSSLRSYEEDAGKVELELARSDSTVWGVWQDTGKAEFGLIEGSLKDDGQFSLRLYSAGIGAQGARLEGKFLEGESRLDGILSGRQGESPRELRMTAVKGASSDFVIKTTEGSEREGLPKEGESTRYRFVGIEPSASSQMRDWYRRKFLEGRDLDTGMQEEKELFLGDFREYARLSSSPGKGTAVIPWFFDGRQFLVHRSKRLFTIGQRVATYSGGAHGVVSTRYMSFDPVEQRALEAEDIFAEGWEEALEPLLTDQARRSLGLGVGSSLVQAGFFEERISPNKNIFICFSGLGFHYNQYEIAQWAAGEFWLVLDWKSVDALLKPGFRALIGGGGEEP